MSSNFQVHESPQVGAASVQRATGARAVVDPTLHRLQRRHFTFFGVVPFLGTLAAVGLLAFRPIGTAEVVAFFVMWLISGLGMTAGYHRLFAHKAYQAGNVTRTLLAISGSMAGQGGVISWVAMHRRHHERSDSDGDMHSPNLQGTGLKGKLRGFLHAHLTWMIAHPYPNVVHYAPDLLRQTNITFVSRHYYSWVLVGLALPALGCALATGSWFGLLSGFLWGGMVRMFVLEHAIWSLNSFCHLVGGRRFVTRDHSRNIGWLAPFIFGESWHHNHHAFPASASFGLAWYRVDPGYWFIRLLALIGLAQEVKVPSSKQIADRLAPLDSASKFSR